MLSDCFENRATREELLRIFTAEFGSGRRGTFTVKELGLWASFLASIGLSPARFAEIRHRLAGVGFLNVAVDGRSLDPDDLQRQERRAAAAGAHCVMIPCVRDATVPGLSDRGYVSIPGMFNCRADLASDWETHLRKTLSRGKRRCLARNLRALGGGYRTEWLTLGELVECPERLVEVSRIYEASWAKFEFPAVHFSRAVLEEIGRTELAPRFRVALTFREGALVRFVLCFVDEASSYIACLVHGIDRARVPGRHNLYCDIYAEVYRAMAHQGGLSTFDMGRGYVDLKLRMGANVVEPLYAHLRPLNAAGRTYVETIASAARPAVAA